MTTAVQTLVMWMYNKILPDLALPTQCDYEYHCATKCTSKRECGVSVLPASHCISTYLNATAKGSLEFTVPVKGKQVGMF